MMSEITYRVSANVTGRTKTIFCKNVDHFSKKICKDKLKKPKPAAKNFLRQKKVSYFLSKYETLSNTNKFVLFNTLACLIVGRRGGKEGGGGELNKMHQVGGGGGRGGGVIKIY